VLTDLRLFLSHSGLDAALSISVQNAIEGHFSALGHRITVFNTSTPHDRFKTLESYVAPGTLWSKEVVAYENELRQYLRQSLNDSSAYLLLVTPHSLAANSKWVHFEIDVARSIARHGKTSFFFPCVADGASLTQLPSGARDFQGLDVRDSTWLERLASAIG